MQHIFSPQTEAITWLRVEFSLRLRTLNQYEITKINNAQIKSTSTRRWRSFHTTFSFRGWHSWVVWVLTSLLLSYCTDSSLRSDTLNRNIYRYICIGCLFLNSKKWFAQKFDFKFNISTKKKRIKKANCQENFDCERLHLLRWKGM